MELNNSKKLILWDLDGTLMLCGSDGTKALNETFYELYGVENAFSKAGIGSAMDSVILERIMESFQLDKMDIDKVKRAYVSTLHKVLNQNENKKILPGVIELLEHIHSSEHSFNALLTSNLRIGAETKLKSVGLHEFFHVGGFGDDYGEKWDAAIKGIAEAEAYYGVSFDRKNIYIVGDSAYDFRCAREIGVTSIGVATGFTEYESLKNHAPDFLYKDLSDWKELIRNHSWK